MAEQSYVQLASEEDELGGRLAASDPLEMQAPAPTLGVVDLAIALALAIDGAVAIALGIARPSPARGIARLPLPIALPGFRV